MPWRYIPRLRSFTSRCGLQVDRLIGSTVPLDLSRPSQAFPTEYRISKKLLICWKKNNVAWRRYKKLPWDSAKFAWKGDRLATDATLFEESCALSLSKGKRGLGPLWMKKILPGNSGGIHGGVYAIVLVVSLGSEKCLSQTTDCSDCPESQGLVYVQNVDTVLNRRRWRHHWSTCGFSTQRNPGRIPQHSFWWNEWTEPNLICIEAGGFHY